VRNSGTIGGSLRTRSTAGLATAAGGDRDDALVVGTGTARRTVPIAE